jgi:hypothetical protein
VPDGDGPEAGGDAPLAEGREERDAGDDPGERDGEDEEEGDGVPPREAAVRQGQRRQVPSTRATAVARSATLVERRTACTRSERSAARANQRRVNPWGGKLKALSSVLKA